MRTYRTESAWLATGITLLGLWAACGDTVAPTGSGCANESDCNGDRICDSGVCVNPAGAGGGSSSSGAGSTGSGVDSAIVASCNLLAQHLTECTCYLLDYTQESLAQL